MTKPVQIFVYDKPVTLTAETILATRKHFADICRACIEGAKAGKFYVNDLDAYVRRNEQEIAHWESTADERMSATFIQRAYWIQSGECVGLLS